jgi:peptidoglycan-associated lipoprotein
MIIFATLKISLFKTSIMKFLKLLFVATLATGISTAAIAQSKLTAKADEEFANGGFNQAAKDYQLALPSVKELDEKGRILFQVGECNRLQTNYAASYEWYEKAITAQYYKANPEVYYNYGLALQVNEKFEEAQVQFNKYIEKGGEKSKANQHIQACKDGAEKKVTKTRLIVENLAEMNSPFFDYALNFSSKKGDQMVFTSSRQAANGAIEDPKTGESFVDIFFSDRDKKGKFSVPQPIAGSVNTASHEGIATFSKDYGTMFYTLCEYRGEERLACDILMSEGGAKGWSAPQPMNLIDRTADDTSMIGQPCLTPDEKFLIFSSDMPGGKGGRDLWYVTMNLKAGTWGKATNLGSVNTSGDEMFPTMTEDGTLYFASNGHSGLGGLDIFKAEKTGEMTFGTPANMGFPINSSSDDFYLVIDKFNQQVKFAGYFTSNRPGGKGKDDLYSFREPAMEFALIGNVYDYDTGAPIQDAKVIILGSDGNTTSLSSDPNGGFSADKDKIKGNINYTVEISKDGYIGTGDKFTTVGLKESTTFAKEYFIKFIVKEKAYDMPEVRYDFSKAELQVNNEVNSKDSLNYLYDLLVKYPTWVIQLESHTDARGSDAANMTLSQGRAQSCVDYLVKEKGIPADRIIAKGKGETEPRALDKSFGNLPKGTVLTEAFINALPTKEEQEFAHQLNRRTIFKIVATDYKAK